MNDTVLAAHLQQLEEDLLTPETRRDPSRVAHLLADDFREFGVSGRIFDKPAILAELSTAPRLQISLSDFACRQLAPHLALVTYRTERPDISGTRRSLRSSLWIHRDNRWQILFHQGTRV